jgi:hypothetical protein
VDLQNANWILTVRFYYKNEKGYVSEATYSFPAYYTIGVAVAKQIDLSKKYRDQIYEQTKDENLKIEEFDCSASVVTYDAGKRRTYVDILISPIVKNIDDVDCDTILNDKKCIAPNFI